MKLTNLVPNLGVADVTRTIEFYQDALNFEVKETYEPDGQPIWAFLKSGDVELMVEGKTPENTQPKKDASLYLYPDDFEALHAFLKKRGYPVSDQRVTFYGMKEFDLADPDGYQLCFGQCVSQETTEALNDCS